MKTKNTYQKWINVAYIEFAECGPDFSLKALSSKANLPRATFYYHFDTKENLIDELIRHHLKIVDEYCNDIKEKVEKLIPDLYHIMFKYLNSVKFHKQLLYNSHNEKLKSLYYSINQRCIELLLPFIRDFFGNSYTDSELVKFYNILTDAWYTRLNLSDITIESMCDLAKEIMVNTLVSYNPEI